MTRQVHITSGLRGSSGQARPPANPIRVLTTKLHPPAPPPDMVARSRVVEQLDVGRSYPLTLVAAPAGCGKSVAIRSWLEACDWSHAWISLDQDDGDLRQFVGYLVAALQQNDEARFQPTILNLRSEAPPSASSLARTFANDLDQSLAPVVVVLDDYHRLDAASSVHEFIDTLLEHPPIALHLVIAARRDPPLQLLKLRARGQVAELRTRELMFNAEESAKLAERVTGRSLAVEQVDQLQRALDGWPAGVRLFGLALRRTTDTERVLETVGDLNGQVHGYLANEILTPLPATTRDWLRMASLLDRFCAELCETVCAPSIDGPAGGQSFIETILREELFVVPLDTSGKWFRFHHVLQDTLRAQLFELFDETADIRPMYLRASEWFEGHGFTAEAIDYALRSGDGAHAAGIVQRQYRQQFDSGLWHVVAGWLALLPESEIRNRPDLMVAEGWVAVDRRDAGRVAAVVERMEMEEELGELSRDLEIFRGFLCWIDGDLEGALTHTDSLLQLPATPRITDGLGLLLYSAVMTLSGRHVEAVDALGPVFDHPGGSEGFRAQVVVALTSAEMITGRYPQVLAHAGRLKSLPVEARARILGLTGISRYYMNDLTGALEDLSEAVEHRVLLPREAAVDSMSALIMVHELLGDAHQADRVSSLLVEYGRQSADSRWQLIAQSIRVRLALLRGDMPVAVTWAAATQMSVSAAELFVLMEAAPLTLARALVQSSARGAHLRARTLLERIEAQSSGYHHGAQLIDCQLLTALLSYHEGSRAVAQKLLSDALALARDGNVLRPFLEAGMPVIELLKEVSADQPHFEFACRIVNAHEASTDRRFQPAESGIDLIEPLTNRELDTLELLPMRLSNKEIAERLFVSQETVKTHLKGIYQKLGVSNRHDAADLADRILAHARASG